jgi:hypothetical protein
MVTTSSSCDGLTNTCATMEFTAGLACLTIVTTVNHGNSITMETKVRSLLNNVTDAILLNNLRKVGGYFPELVFTRRRAKPHVVCYIYKFASFRILQSGIKATIFNFIIVLTSYSKVWVSNLRSADLRATRPEP